MKYMIPNIWLLVSRWFPPRLTQSLAVAVVAATLAPAALLADHDGDDRGGSDRGRGDDHRGRDEHYIRTNLVSDLPGVAALQDPDLVNAWGISFNPTGPFWVSDNATGLSTLYSVTNDPSGNPQVAKLPLIVAIPGEGSVTGQAFDASGSFNSNVFLFASEDGIISGWRPALGTAAEVLSQDTNAVYKGIAWVPTAAGPVLLAANFRGGTLDVFDTSLDLVGQFADSRAPEGYAPFNVQVIAGHVFVTFAKQDDDGEDDIAGPGHGLIDIFVPETGRFHRFATGSDAGGRLRALNSPWGLALAPKSFGEHGGELLVGNFGNGTIMAFDLRNGRFQGLLEDQRDQPIVIDGLWGLTFGNGGRAGRPDTLYFSAGPGGESHGLFGSIAPAGHGRKDRH
jgi:uncharacterized protein (TIGR03118 family)